MYKIYTQRTTLSCKKDHLEHCGGGIGNALNLYARIALMTLGVCFAALFTIAKIMGLSVTYTIGATKTVYIVKR